MRYKKYFRKTSLKQRDIGEQFLNEIASKKPKNFLEIGVFHGVTARNVCELLYNIHHDDFRYIGLDLFGEISENTDEVIPNTKFNNPLKKIRKLFGRKLFTNIITKYFLNSKKIGIKYYEAMRSEFLTFNEYIDFNEDKLFLSIGGGLGGLELIINKNLQNKEYFFIR